MAGKVKDIDKGYKNLFANLVTKKKKQDGYIGVFGDARNKLGLSIAEYGAANEFGTAQIPKRPFMRTAYDEQIKAARMLMNKYIREYMLKNKGNLLYSGLKVAASFMSTQIKLKITNSKSWALPNSPHTIALKTKGGRVKNTPLINTGALRNSITWRIK